MKLGVPWTSKGKKGNDRSVAHDDAESVHERLDDLTRQLERLSRVTAGKIRPPEPPPRAVARDRHTDDDDDDDEASYGRAEPRAREFAEDPGARRDVARYAGDRTLNRNPLRPVYSDASLDQTVAEITARQRALEGEGRRPERRGGRRSMTPPAQNLSGLEEQLRKITTQIDALRQPSVVDETVPALREELSEISRSLAEAMPRRAIEAIETEVRGLAARLDLSRQSGIDGSALGNLEHGLTEVRDALRSLKPAESLVGFQTAIQGLTRKIDGIVATHQDPVVLQQLESAITGLRGIVAHVASDDTLARLTEEVRRIATKVERIAGSTTGPDALSNLERQIGAIAEAIDQSNAQGRQVPAKLETMVRGLADKMEHLQPNRGDTIAFGQLEDRITKLVEKLDTSGSRLNSLEAIERGVADMLVHLEEQRGRGGGALRAAGDPAVETLKRELDAVNGTLNRVVDRLATIETGIRGGARPAAASAPLPPPPPAAPPAPPPVPAKPGPRLVAAAPAKPVAVQPTAPVVAPVVAPVPAPQASPPAKPMAPPSERLAAAAQAQRPATLRERLPIDPNLPPDHPLEPGAAYTRAAQSPADRIAASEAALGDAKPATPPEASGKSNFLAAARRAAQAALRLPKSSDAGKQPAPPPAPVLPAAPVAPAMSASTDDLPPPSLARRIAGRLRSLLVGASVVIIVLGAMRLLWPLIESGPAPESKKPVSAPAIQTPSKSNARVPLGATVPGSALPEGGNAVVPPADVPDDEAPILGGDDRPATAPPSAPPPSSMPAPSAPAPTRDDVTGSIATPAPQVTVPLPPNRPEGASAAPASSRLVTAANAGDPAAAYELADRYIDGRGLPRNHHEAAQWLARASKHGLAPAQFRLGSLYEKGLGVKKDLNEARRLYEAAAAKGNAKAMHNLAVLHAEGIDGKPDYEVAIRWFRKAADHGVADSQYNLGVLYARGVGVEQNLAESYKWFALAAQQGDKDAGSKRDDIAGRLDAESLMAARLAIKTWTAETQPPEAVTVTTPPGGWDREAPPATAKRRPRPSAPLKLGPG